MKTIYEHMSITQQAYNDLLWKLYFKYCDGQSHNLNDLQRLLANKKMYRFFMVQITGLEVDLIEEMQPYVHLKDGPAMTKLWLKHTNVIHGYYNDALKQQARKLTIINTIQKHDLRLIQN